MSAIVLVYFLQRVLAATARRAYRAVAARVNPLDMFMTVVALSTVYLFIGLNATVMHDSSANALPIVSARLRVANSALDRLPAAPAARTKFLVNQLVKYEYNLTFVPHLDDDTASEWIGDIYGPIAAANSGARFVEELGGPQQRYGFGTPGTPDVLFSRRGSLMTRETRGSPPRR